MSNQNHKPHPSREESKLVELRRELNELRAIIENNEELAAPRANVNPSTEKLKQRIAAYEAQIRAADEALETGPQKFHVALPGNPQRVVGAADEHQAWDKYAAHYGILATTQPKHLEPAAA